MTTSTNDSEAVKRETLKREALKREAGGAFADGLTLVRVLLTPIIMFVIIKAWSGDASGLEGGTPLNILNIKLVFLASFLFVVAAVTDFLDDYFGGNAQTSERQFGWIDDIADSLLIGGTLLALLWVTNKAGLLSWTFAIPAAAFIGRDIILALVKGFEMSKYGLVETRLGDIKSALAMLGTCILVAAPWLSNLVDNWRATNAEDMLSVYGAASTWVWNAGLAILWGAAILALVTGWKVLTRTAAKHD